MKRQHIGKDGSQQSVALLERAYRELRIMLQLAQLHADSRCSHFIQLLDYVKAKPPLLFPGRYEPDDVFMYYVLEYAAVDLHTLRADAPRYLAAATDAVGAANSTNLTVSAFDERVGRMRSVLFGAVSDARGFTALVFQILWALACAQKRYSFVHNDLHMKNVLLCLPDHSETCQAYLDDSNQCWFTDRFLVKIADFGLSRITLASKNEVLYNTNNSYSELFDPARDLSELSNHLPLLRRAFVPASASNDQETLLWRSFVTALKRAPNAKVMLSHRFFDILKQRSPFMASDNTRFQCFNGAEDVPRLRRYVRNVLAGQVDPNETIGAAEMVEIARMQATDKLAGVPDAAIVDGKVLRSQRRGVLSPQYVLSSFVRNKVAPVRKQAPTKRRPYKKRHVAPVSAVPQLDSALMASSSPSELAVGSTSSTPAQSSGAVVATTDEDEDGTDVDIDGFEVDEPLAASADDDDDVTVRRVVVAESGETQTPVQWVSAASLLGASDGDGVAVADDVAPDVNDAADNVTVTSTSRVLFSNNEAPTVASVPSNGVTPRRSSGGESKNKSDFRAFRDMFVFLEHGMRRPTQ